MSSFEDSEVEFTRGGPMLDRPKLGAAGGDGGASITPGFVLHAVRQNLLVASAIGLVLAALAGAAVWLTFEPVYSATASLRIVDQQPYIVFPTADDSQQFVNTQVELIKSPFILRQTLELPEISSLPEIKEVAQDSEPLDWLRTRLTVRPIGRSELVDVGFTGPSGENSALIVNSIVSVYIAAQSKEYGKQRQTFLDLLVEERRVRERGVEQLRNSLAELLKAAGREGAVPEAPGSVVVDRYSTLSSHEQRLTDAQVESEVLRARTSALNEMSAKAVEVSQSQVEQSLATDAELIDLRAQVSTKRTNLGNAVPGSASYARVEKEIADLEQRIAKRIQIARPLIVDQLRNTVTSQRDQELATLQTELKTQEMMVSLLTEKADEERKKLQDRGGNTVEIEQARSELARAEAVHQRIAQRIIELQTEARAPDRVTVVLQAIPPRFPVKAWPMKELGVAVVGSFGLPFGLFVAWAWFMKRVYEPDQILRDTQLPVIGEIATLPVRSLAPRLGGARRYQRDSMVFEESVHSLRTALSVNDSIKEYQALVICSAVSGEGKTNLSAQLAISWARCSREPVLLIDGDLRAPELHSMFCVDDGPGLSELLRGECTLEQSIFDGWGQHLHILPAGKLRDGSPHVLFSGRRFERVIEALRKRYVRIVIDSPPILTASESLVVCKAADAALLCTLRDHSRSSQIKQACARLSQAGVQVTGAVLNGTPTRSYVYQYGTY